MSWQRRPGSLSRGLDVVHWILRTVFSPLNDALHMNQGSPSRWVPSTPTSSHLCTLLPHFATRLPKGSQVT